LLEGALWGSGVGGPCLSLRWGVHGVPPPHPSGPHLPPPGLKKWVEVGNSGVFRPELLLPMGLPENVSVIAWGLSLER